jgi:hypothetical protein
LRIGRRWQKFSAHPSGGGRFGLSHIPLHLAVPTGFGPAAGWAQAVTDTATNDANIPNKQRVTFRDPVPGCFPIWGSILDDVWTIEAVTDESEEDIFMSGLGGSFGGQWPKTGGVN